MQPIIFEFKGITIYSLWFFIALALFAGTMIFGQLSQKSRLRLQLILDLSPKLLLGAIIGGRLVQVLLNLPLYFSGFQIRKILSIFAIWDTELSFWGAIIGLCYVFYKNVEPRGENMKKWADIFVISLISAMSIGNIGSYMGGLNYGKETILPIGITFNSAFVKYTVPIHPTQIYAAIYCALIAGFLYYVYQKYRAQYEGLILLLGVTLYSYMRFLEGFVRGDDVLTIWIFRLPQIVFLLIGIYSTKKLISYQRKNHVPLLKPFEKWYKKSNKR